MSNNPSTASQIGDVIVKAELRSSLHESHPINNDLVGGGSPKTGRSIVRRGRTSVVMSRKQQQQQQQQLLDATEGWVQEFFRRSPTGLITTISNWVPKHLISIDEKYLRCCLEVIYITAFDIKPQFSQNSSLELGFLAQGWPAAHRIPRKGGSGKSCIDDHPSMETGSGGEDAPEVDQWVVGSITESESMKSILRSPLFQRIGMLENADDHAPITTTDLTDNKRFLRPRLTGSSELSYTSSQKLERDSLSVGGGSQAFGYVSDSIQRSPGSVWSSSSMEESTMLIDQAASCSCSYPRNSQGMLQCLWKDGLPHFEFSVDDQKELYMASPVNAGLLENDDHVYVFQMKPCGSSSCSSSSSQYDKSPGWSSEVIGKMKVSTSHTVCCRCSSKVMETDFVFYGLGDDIHGSESQSAVALRGGKHRKLSRVVELFKSSQLFKQRGNSRFGGGGGSGSGSNNTIWEDHHPKGEVGSRSVFPMENTDPFDFTPNRELAAVVVKHHVQEVDSHKRREEDAGGWGLKFLKKTGVKQINTTLHQAVKSPPPPPSCGGVSGQCAGSSTDVILSSGIHGMPRSGKEMPSSIIERWKSGGSCDCGGWDEGCPLRVLISTPRKEDGMPPGSDGQNDCKSFDVFLEGSSEQGTPVLKMTNIHDGLYFVNFRSSVPVVQCFAVAVAMVHSHLPNKQCTGGVRLQEYL